MTGTFVGSEEIYFHRFGERIENSYSLWAAQAGAGAAR